MLRPDALGTCVCLYSHRGLRENRGPSREEVQPKTSIVKIARVVDYYDRGVDGGGCFYYKN